MGGTIGKSKESGKLNGLFFDEAMKLIRKVFPKLTNERLNEAYEKISQKMIRKGITCFADASTKEPYFDIYLNSVKQAENQNEKPKPRPIAYLSWKDFRMNEWSLMTMEERMEIFQKIKEKAKVSNFKADTIKIFIDGVIESVSAALKAPYLSSQENLGLLHYSNKNLTELLSLSNRYKFKMHYHVVGDRAFHQIVSLIAENNTKFSETQKIKHTLAHVQMVDEQDLKNLAKNINLCFSPLWCYKDFCYKITKEELGLKRCQNLYPIKFFNPENHDIGFGSDWPVSSMNPLKGIEIAVTRLGLGGKNNEKKGFKRNENKKNDFDCCQQNEEMLPNNEKLKMKEENVFCPEQRIGLLEALRSYTLGAAKICGVEKTLGSLEVGKQADLIILDNNILDFGENEMGKIHKTKVILTIIKGEIVYKKLKKFENL